MSLPISSAGDRIVCLVMASLPADINRRKQILGDLLLVAEKVASDAIAEEVSDASASLARHLNSQREFQMPAAAEGDAS